MKRTANLIDASLPAPPSVDTFVSTLNCWNKARNSPPLVVPDPVHDTAYLAEISGKPLGSQGTEVSGVLAVLAFAKLCESLQAVYPTLDAWLSAFARWVLDTWYHV